MLLAAIDERHRGTYDFIYLPIDFKVWFLMFRSHPSVLWEIRSAAKVSSFSLFHHIFVAYTPYVIAEQM